MPFCRIASRRVALRCSLLGFASGVGLVPRAWANPAKKTKAREELEVELPSDPRQAKQLGRASHKTDQAQWRRAHAQSAPEALARTPGVYIQKSAHAQASPFIRGLTGQRNVILFDKIRLNTSTYRQGPNQYFFTVDHQSLASLEVVRGSASTLYGSDALGGAILSQPLRASPPPSTRGFWWKSALEARTHSADDRYAGRASAQMGWSSTLRAIGGFSARKVGMLQSAGPIRSPIDGLMHKSPSFERDLRTQVGTGFKEYTGDFRLTFEPRPSLQIFGAMYRYRQRDAPRTDKCPPLEGRAGECLVYKKQDRDLSYLGAEIELPSSFWSRLSARLSVSRQYEWRQWFLDNLLPEVPGGTQSDAHDDVWTYGALFHLYSHPIELAPNWSIQALSGADLYRDQVSSDSQQQFTDVQPAITLQHPRGQYMEGSTYLSAGAFAQAELRYKNRLWAELGGRTSWVHAQVPPEPRSDTQTVSRHYLPLAAHLGFHLRLSPRLRWQNNIDRGFRAPNLDDLSGRQQVGPGFQFENHTLRPERSWSFDSGLRFLAPTLQLAFFAFHTRIQNAITRVPRTIDACPDSQSGPEGCLASRTRFSLVNLGTRSELWGAEASARWQIVAPLGLEASLSYAWGQGASPDPLAGPQVRVPLSRVPPLHGHLAWNHRLYKLASGQLRWGGALQWAAAQKRLALADRADARIPLGGTPGYLTAHLELSWEPSELVEFSMMLENLFDSPYRNHGSSVNGAGRSVRARLRVALDSHLPRRRP